MLAACLWAKLPNLGLTQAPDLSPRSPQHIPPLVFFLETWSLHKPAPCPAACPPHTAAVGPRLRAACADVRGRGTTAISCFSSRLPTSRNSNEKGNLHPVPDEGQITSATKKKELALGDRMYIFLMYRSTEDIGDLWFSNGLHSVPPSCHLGYSSLHLHLLSSWF